MKWEYLIDIWPCKADLQQLALNHLGQEGWELVTVTTFEGEQIAYFKRPRRGLNRVRGLSRDEFEARIIQALRRNL